MSTPRTLLTSVVSTALTTAIIAFGSSGFTATAQAASPPASTLAKQDRDVYYPGTEDIAPDEMRVVACGTGLVTPRPKQAAACWLVELGNGDKFLFDIGAGSHERIAVQKIPYDYLNKVFIGHLHVDHYGDLASFWLGGTVMNRLVPLRIWGPSGATKERGTAYAMEHMQKMYTWDIATRSSVIDARGMALEINEFDYKAVNNVIYNENGVVIKSIPAIHLEQSVSFILEWNGLTMAFSGDTLPNKWWIENTKGIDFSIHECIFMPDMAMLKWGFSAPEALNAMTTVHANPSFFGKVMAMTKPKHAVAYHFQNDFDTLPGVMKAVEQYYDGPVDYAQDFMVWNITKEGVRTRMAVTNPEAYPTPALKEKKIEAGGDRYQTPDSVLAGWPEEFQGLTEQIYDDFNKKHGTDFKFQLKK